MGLDERARIRIFTQGAQSRLNEAGFEDDCAALPFNTGEYLLLSTDVAQRETHFPPRMTPRQTGAYVVNANLSDVAAMGGSAIGILVALGLPKETDEAFLTGLREGVLSALQVANAELLGGDTKPNPILTLAGTAVGRVSRAGIIRRAGARPGDLLAVTGTLGGAGAGLHALRESLDPALAARLLEPRARLAEGRALAGLATAGMDLSDGLALGVHDLARASGLGAQVDAAKLPVDPVATQVDGDRARGWALFAGGDFELLVALPPGREAEARAAVEAAGGALTPVGRFLGPGEPVSLVEGGARRALPRRGYVHFRDPSPD